MNMLKGLNYYFFQLGLDFYHQVKIVNYIRRQVYVYVQCQLQALDLTDLDQCPRRCSYQSVSGFGPTPAI